MANFSKGTGYSKSDLKGTGSPIILYGRLYTKYETIIRNVDTFVVPKSGSVFSKGGEVIVPGSGETAEDISIASVVELAGILLGGDLNIIYPNSDLDPAFLAITISNGKPHFDMARRAQGKSVVHLHNADLKHILLKTPNLSEQKRISKIFESLDHTITLHEEKKRQLERLKSALLQKVFADKNGYPGVRFKGFSDEWEQCKLGDISSSYSGGTPKAGTRKYYNGKIPFIRSGEISNDFTELTITEDGLRNSAAKMVGKGDILYALYGATSGEVSIARINGAINQAIMAIKPFEGFDSYLLASLLQNNKTKITEKYLQGGQGNLSATIVKNLKLKVPSSKEQKLIGILLLRLDRSITLYEHKLELLKRLKCSLLQNMFI